MAGYQETSGPLYFRIGLKNKWSTNTKYNVDTNPVRYAAVVLSYGSQGAKQWKNQTIWIRQGEDADYMYANTEEMMVYRSHGYPTTSITRSNAKKFSPYNLATKKAPYDNNTAGVYFVGPREGAFVDYPSQAGMAYYWAANGGWYDQGMGDPFTDTNPAPAGYALWFDENNYMDGGWLYGYPDPNPGYYSGNFDSRKVAIPQWWDDTNIKNKFEYCPTGYRRWSDGATNANPDGRTNISSGNVSVDFSSGDRTDSEIYQSLWQYTGSGTNVQPPQSQEGLDFCYGYYADGYFDRRTLKRPLMGLGGSWNNTLLRAGGESAATPMAYSGLFVYRTDNCHSLFFPATGSTWEDVIGSADGIEGMYIGSSAFITQDTQRSPDRSWQYGVFASEFHFSGPITNWPEIMLGAWGVLKGNAYDMGNGVVLGSSSGYIRCVKE
jgi:hypothetical protein